MTMSDKNLIIALVALTLCLLTSEVKAMKFKTNTFTTDVNKFMLEQAHARR